MENAISDGMDVDTVGLSRLECNDYIIKYNKLIINKHQSSTKKYKKKNKINIIIITIIFIDK